MNPECGVCSLSDQCRQSETIEPWSRLAIHAYSLVWGDLGQGTVGMAMQLLKPTARANNIGDNLGTRQSIGRHTAPRRDRAIVIPAVRRQTCCTIQIDPGAADSAVAFCQRPSNVNAMQRLKAQGLSGVPHLDGVQTTLPGICNYALAANGCHRTARPQSGIPFAVSWRWLRCRNCSRSQQYR